LRYNAFQILLSIFCLFITRNCTEKDLIFFLLSTDLGNAMKTAASLFRKPAAFTTDY